MCIGEDYDTFGQNESSSWNLDVSALSVPQFSVFHGGEVPKLWQDLGSQQIDSTTGVIGHIDVKDTGPLQLLLRGLPQPNLPSVAGSFTMKMRQPSQCTETLHHSDISGHFAVSSRVGEHSCRLSKKKASVVFNLRNHKIEDGRSNVESESLSLPGSRVIPTKGPLANERGVCALGDTFETRSCTSHFSPNTHVSTRDGHRHDTTCSTIKTEQNFNQRPSNAITTRGKEKSVNSNSIRTSDNVTTMYETDCSFHGRRQNGDYGCSFSSLVESSFAKDAINPFEDAYCSEKADLHSQKKSIDAVHDKLSLRCMPSRSSGVTNFVIEESEQSTGSDSCAYTADDHSTAASGVCEESAIENRISTTELSLHRKHIQKFRISDFSVEADNSPGISLMLRNIPNRFTPLLLLNMLFSNSRIRSEFPSLWKGSSLRCSRQLGPYDLAEDSTRKCQFSCSQSNTPCTTKSDTAHARRYAHYLQLREEHEKLRQTFHWKEIDEPDSARVAGSASSSEANDGG